MAIKYVYLLLYTMVLYLTFSIVTLFKKKSILLFLSIRGKRKKKHLEKQKWLKNVGGKADSLPAPLFYFILCFLCCFVTKM